MALSLARFTTSLRSALLNSGTLLEGEAVDSVSANVDVKRITILSEQYTVLQA